MKYTQVLLGQQWTNVRNVLYGHQALLWLVIIFSVAMFCHWFWAELPVSVPINGPACLRILRQNPRRATCSLGHRGSRRDGPEFHFFLGEAWTFPLLALFSIKREQGSRSTDINNAINTATKEVIYRSLQVILK